MEAIRRSVAPLVLSCLVLSAVASAPATADTGSLVSIEDWRFSAYGAAIGGQGLVVRDIDRDGTVEIVATATFFASPRSEYRWYILGRDATGYSQKWVSPVFTEPIEALAVTQADGDRAREVVVVTAGRGLVYDGATHVLERTIPGLPVGIKAMAIGDVDRDGAREIVSTDGTDLFVNDLATGALEYLGAGLGGVTLAIGDVNGNPGLEIVVGNGASPGFVIGGLKHRLLWTRPEGFGSKVAIGDVDGDGRNEIVCGPESSSRGIAVLDAVSRTAKQTRAISEVTSVAVADVDGDGRAEVLYGDAAHRNVHVLDGATLSELWSSTPATTPGSVSSLAAADIDADGTREIVLGTGGVGPANLHVIDGSSHLETWTSPAFAGPFETVFADLDLDGHRELLAGSASVIYSSNATWMVHDAQTHALEYTYAPNRPPVFYGSGSRVLRIAAANVDDDAQPEVIVAAGGASSNGVAAYDGLTHAEQWRHSFANGQAFTSLAVADVDGDGALEVVAGTQEFSSTSVFVLDAATGAVEWQTGDLGPDRRWALLRVANLGGGTPKMVVGDSLSTTEGHLAVIDAATRSVNVVVTPALSALDVADLDGDGIDELVAGTQDGRLVVIDPATGGVVRVIGDYGTRIDGLAVRDLDGDGQADYAFALGSTVQIFSGTDGHRLWSSDPLDTGGSTPIEVGREDHLVVTRPAAGGRFKIAVSTGLSGFTVFNLQRPLDRSTGGVRRVIRYYLQRIDALAARDLDGDGRTDWAIVMDDVVSIMSGADGSTLWSSGRLSNLATNDPFAPPRGLGRDDDLVITRPTAKGRFRLALSVGSNGFAVFKLRPAPTPVLADR